MATLDDYIKTLPPTLSKEEQKELFTKYKETGDIALRDKLVHHNMRLAANVVSTMFMDKGFEPEDMVQHSFVALIQAVETYNTAQKTAFSTYATACIKNYLINLLRQTSHHSVKPDYFLYDEVKLNSHSNIEDKDLILINMLKDEDESDIQGDFVKKDFLKRVNTYVKKNFKGRELEVYNALMGIGYDRPQTLKEIGKKMGVSHQVVALIKKRIKDKLTENFNELQERV